MSDASENVEQSRYWFGVGAIALGIVLSLTVVGAVIGVPMGVIGVVLILHTWWKDFGDAEVEQADPA